MDIKWIGSPNYTEGREGGKIDRIVMHWMVGTLAGTDKVFQDKVRNTSAHYGIENDVIHQYVKDEDTAYHAGDWLTNCRTIGIEHSAAPNKPASDKTYNTSIALVAELCKKYKIPVDDKHIIPHNSIVATQCPGTLDLQRIINGVAELLKPSQCEKQEKEIRRLLELNGSLQTRIDSLTKGMDKCKEMTETFEKERREAESLVASLKTEINQKTKTIETLRQISKPTAYQILFNTIDKFLKKRGKI